MAPTREQAAASLPSVCSITTRKTIYTAHCSEHTALHTPALAPPRGDMILTTFISRPAWQRRILRSIWSASYNALICSQTWRTAARRAGGASATALINVSITPQISQSQDLLALTPPLLSHSSLNHLLVSREKKESIRSDKKI